MSILRVTTCLGPSNILIQLPNRCCSEWLLSLLYCAINPCCMSTWSIRIIFLLFQNKGGSIVILFYFRIRGENFCREILKWMWAAQCSFLDFLLRRPVLDTVFSLADIRMMASFSLNAGYDYHRNGNWFRFFNQSIMFCIATPKGFITSHLLTDCHHDGISSLDWPWPRVNFDANRDPAQMKIILFTINCHHRTRLAWNISFVKSLTLAWKCRHSQRWNILWR